MAHRLTRTAMCSAAHIAHALHTKHCSPPPLHAASDQLRALRCFRSVNSAAMHSVFAPLHPLLSCSPEQPNQCAPCLF
eukprot:3940967-Rhodomonas_salina.1